VAGELNVKTLETLTGVGELVSYTVKPNFKALGPRFGPRVKDVAGALSRVDPHQVVVDIEDSGTTTIEVDGETVGLTRDDLDIRVEGRSGFALAQEGHYGVALDLDLSPELVAEGVAREVVRGVQDLRKATGLAVEDRIELFMSSDEAEVGAALETHLGTISAEVLATTTHVNEDHPEGLSADEIALDQGRVKVALRKSSN
jgi:isoleucyl-tRNA synthetase